MPPTTDLANIHSFVAQGRATSDQPSTDASRDDVGQILDSISGLAGDVVGVVNAFRRNNAGETKPVSKPNTLASWFSGQNLAIAVGAVLGIGLLVWLLKK